MVRRNSNKRNSNRRNSNKRNNRTRKVFGGDGQQGRTVMTESYFGRPTIGFGPVANSPQTQAEVDAMRVPHTVTGGGRLESAGHWNQAPTGWENAPSHCSVEVKGDVKLGGGRRRTNRNNKRRSNNRRTNRNNKRRSNNRRSNNRRSNNRRSNNRRSNNRRSNRRSNNRRSNRK